MTRMVGRFTDRLLSLVAPSVTASAGSESRCFLCSSTRSKLCIRDCGPNGCGNWGCAKCDSC
jgi:hypothetical protein